ncbi:3202_t:CDS:2, partial [Acaulospora colombiana]
IFNENKEKISEEKREELFNEEWKEIEKDQEDFLRVMTMKIEKLEQLVVNSFNNAIKNGRAISSDTNHTEESFKKVFIRNLKDKIEALCTKICHELQRVNALSIKFDQAPDWLGTLSDKIYHTLNNDSIHIMTCSFTIEIDDFSPIEQYMRLKVFNTLVDNTEKWKSSQKFNHKKLRKDLFKYFNDILNNSSDEIISAHFFQCIAQSVDENLDAREQLILEVMKTYVKENWSSVDKNPTRRAYEQSFGAYDVKKSHEYVKNSTLFMRNLFERDIDAVKNKKIEEILKETGNVISGALEKLGENISTWQRRLSSSDKNLPLKQITKETPSKGNIFLPLIRMLFKTTRPEICPESLMEDAIRILGECNISSPQDFCIMLKKDHINYMAKFEKLWRSERSNNSKMQMENYVELYKEVYWDDVKGCEHRCPFCGSKCELKHEPNTNHRASFHLMHSYNGLRYNESRKASLMTCNELDCHNYRLHRNGDDGLQFKEYVKKYHPEWWTLLGSKNSDDDQIRQ